MQNAAALWALAHQRALTHRDSLLAAGLEGDGMALGEALFERLITSPSGLVTSSETWADVWQRVPGGSIELSLDDLLEEAVGLMSEYPEEVTDEFPLLLAAGERRSFTANTIIRDPAWRRKDAEGALHIHPDDAARLNLGENSQARVTSGQGAVVATVALSERMHRGHVSLPNGMGLSYPDEPGDRAMCGVAPNELTSTELRDAFAGTPWHKSVPVRVEPA